MYIYPLTYLLMGLISVACLYMTSGLATWYWIPIRSLIPGEDCFHHSQHTLFDYSSLSRGGAL